MKSRFILSVVVAWLAASTAFAGPPSLTGGKRLQSRTAHHLGVGWPSLTYEWWHSGKLEWALGAELVYGDWSGAFSDVQIGGAFNIPLRWHLKTRGHRNAITDIAFRFTPGVLVGNIEAPGDDLFVFGVRGEFAVPVSIDVHERVNIVTGAAIPVSVYFVEDGDPFVVLPLLGRIGVEVGATERIVPWLLFELGPGLAFGDFGTEVEFAFRIWVGTTFF